MKRTFSKKEWKNAPGASEKPKRLKLEPDISGIFLCPLNGCDSNAYRSQRGCRKHVTEKHGWYFYFNEKPKLEDAGGGGKDKNQALQICKKILKFAKFCCTDIDDSFELTKNLLEYCLGSVKFIERFVVYLETECKMGKPGMLSYLQSLGHCLDFLRYQGIDSKKISIFMTSEVFLSRAKQCLRKQMRVEWNTLLSIETLESKNRWATLADLQNVLPFHETRYKKVIILAKSNNHTSHDLSFATAFIVSLLFLKVKGTRPMTYRFITVPMINGIEEEGGIIDQTKFKTKETYAFDSLLLKKKTLSLIKDYIEFVRPKFKPTCQYLLVCRNGNQVMNLGDMFGRIVYQAIGKYINPTRYRQIIETESSERLSVEEQAIVSLDQKHTSNVAKVHYQKRKSREVARKASECIKSLVAGSSKSDTTDCSSANSDDSETDKNSSSDSFSPFPDSAQVEPHKVNVKSTEPPKRKQKISFSEEEDRFLLEGMRKHGKGKWKVSIIKLTNLVTLYNFFYYT